MAANKPERDEAYWRARCHLTGGDYARSEGIHPSNGRRAIQRARKRFPDLPWGEPPATGETKDVEGTEHLADGGYRSIKLLTMTAKQSKSKAFLLKAHGFDEAEWEATRIGNRVSIGSNATLLPVSICDDVVIGAGAVVTRDIRESGVYAGNPARRIRDLPPSR